VWRAVQRKTGLRTVFHHYIGTRVETPQETCKLLRMTDPGVLGLVLDTSHSRFGGSDPLRSLAQMLSRFVLHKGPELNNFDLAEVQIVCQHLRQGLCMGRRPLQPHADRLVFVARDLFGTTINSA